MAPAVQILRRSDSDYPARLQHVHSPPDTLHLMGPFRDWGLPCVAIVGARAASVRGSQMTEELASDLARGGVVIASGMARGIDRAAHEGALAVGGKTLAVLGTGIDIVYPREHAALSERIAETGLLLTEFPPGSPPRSFHFPRRNRILAGLADVVVVVEAEPRSGALVTARWAMELGREIMAVPRSPWEPGSLGVNRLLRDGAHPVLEVEDVSLALNRLGFRLQETSGKAPSVHEELGGAAHAPPESRVLSALASRGPLDCEGLCEAIPSIPLPDLLSLLGRLELEGKVQKGRQGYEIPRAQPALRLSP